MLNLLFLFIWSFKNIKELASEEVSNNTPQSWDYRFKGISFDRFVINFYLPVFWNIF